MRDLWQTAGRRSSEFDAIALAYDRFRPRYPFELFDDIVELGELTESARVLEVGSGTGIATQGLVDKGLDVTALEPAPSMAAIARARLGTSATIEVTRFEDWDPGEPVQAVAAFNAWHWVQPQVGLDQACRLLAPGGSLAIVWTEVISWGEAPFEARLADAFGAAWPKTVDAVTNSARPVEASGLFVVSPSRRYRFERVLDSETFVAVTRTYGGTHTAERDESIRTIIDVEMGGTVTKIEEAVLKMARLR